MFINDERLRGGIETIYLIKAFVSLMLYFLRLINIIETGSCFI